jgi:chromosome segregation ATPase
MSKSKVRDLDHEIDELDRQVAQLEAEKAGLPEPLSWDELMQAGAVQQVEQAELRRGVIPRMLRAARTKRLQLELARLERRLEPIVAEQEQAYERREELGAQIRELQEQHGREQHAWTHAGFRRDTLEREQRNVRKQLRELNGDAS